MYFIYNIILQVFAPILILFFISKKHAFENITALRWRLGYFPLHFLPPASKDCRIWIHASSVGEVNAMIPFVKELREQYTAAWIGISVMTDSGLKIARENLPEADEHFLAPFDLFFAARRAMRRIRPSLFITAETEIWPNLLWFARRYGAQILMVNGRISSRSIAFYLKFRRFFRKVLANYDLFSVILPEDAERIIAIGAPSHKVQINGNMKYDRLFQQVNSETHEKSKQIFNFTGEETVLIAGSTREGEEEVILKAFKELKEVIPNLYLMIAPRHIKRANEVCQIVQGYGLNPILRTDITPETRLISETVIVLNTIGELSKIYSIATIAFCGASLVPLGGQNPLEPASWGKPVLYGPSMEDFLDAKALLEAIGVGFEVHDAESLAKQAAELLQDTHRLDQLKKIAMDTLMMQQGSVHRNLHLVSDLIKGGVSPWSTPKGSTNYTTP